MLHGLIRCRVDHADKHHITGKPVEAMRKANAICSPGGIILDPFAGSGSTGVAALRDGYRFVGVEQTEAYHATAQRRLAAEDAGIPMTAKGERAGQTSLLDASPK